MVDENQYRVPGQEGVIGAGGTAADDRPIGQNNRRSQAKQKPQFEKQTSNMQQR